MSEKYDREKDIEKWLERNGESGEDKDSRERQKRYMEKHGFRNLTIQFMRHTEADILEWVESQPNKAGYIKRLIREDMEKQNKKEQEG